ncbi:hypothetical protein H0H81_009204 [Sphagnurus paluster]|uniref:Uncharacterized protein n=1 Tax=Sphagnurus paluster TaxID=117069 RepID=A0A9P7GIK2_9AGAR|nr:hypothetical protein H0H81_009204 [Sphagnurus paluster]
MVDVFKFKFASDATLNNLRTPTTTFLAQLVELNETFATAAPLYLKNRASLTLSPIPGPGILYANLFGDKTLLLIGWQVCNENSIQAKAAAVASATRAHRQRGMLRGKTYVAVKISALVSNANALIKLSRHILSTHAPIPFPGSPLSSDLDILTHI